MSVRKIAVLNGPNLHWLGRREPEIYGGTTLEELEDDLVAYGRQHGCELVCFQTNHEGDFVEHIYTLAAQGVSDLIINAGAYTHTSIAIRDALKSVDARFVEVHISNVYARETFRHHSYLSDIASGIIVGCGIQGYTLALDWFIRQN